MRHVTANRLTFVGILLLTAGWLYLWQNIPDSQPTSVVNNASCPVKNNVDKQSPKFIVYTRSLSTELGGLRIVFNVLNRVGFTRVLTDAFNATIPTGEWTLLWAHDEAYRPLKNHLIHARPHQKINKLVGGGLVTSKSRIVIDNADKTFIPKAFVIPDMIDDLQNYSKHHPNEMFVQKNSDHRGIQIQALHEIEVNKTDSFVQLFIHNPLLIDGHKFDIGVYVTVTDVDPLRIYVFDTDFLIRFCTKPYLPFDADDQEKYVVKSNYKPVWEMPSLKDDIIQHGLTFKTTFNNYFIEKLHVDPEKIVWQRVNDIISDVFQTAQNRLVDAAIGVYGQDDPDGKTGPAMHQFEMVRFDFMMDDQLNVHLMEVNMSPNLNPTTHAYHGRLFEQVVYSTLRVAGVVKVGNPNPSDITRHETDNRNIRTRDSSSCPTVSSGDNNDCYWKADCVFNARCQLVTWQDRQLLAYLSTTSYEHFNMPNLRRIHPPTAATAAKKQDRRPDERLTDFRLRIWLAIKCNADQSWCQ